LNGDLALALVVDDNYDYLNPFWAHAKYRWAVPAFDDYGKAFDLVQRRLCRQQNILAPDWRSMLRIKGIWQGGIQCPDPQPSASALLPFCRWLLLHGLQMDDVLRRYDRFVITRSDFVWLCPHPPLSVLDNGALWFPDGERYGGLPDRHLVVSRADVVNCLNIIEDIVLHPIQLYEEMKHLSDVNNEQFLADHLRRKGILHKVKQFPYVMYAAREVRDESPTWSRGRYEPAVGHYVKYENEFRAASAYATIIRSRADWENGAWLQFDPASVACRPVPALRRLHYACERAFYDVLSALSRPGRVARFVRFYKRMLSRTVRQPADGPM